MPKKFKLSELGDLDQIDVDPAGFNASTLEALGGGDRFDPVAEQRLNQEGGVLFGTDSTVRSYIDDSLRVAKDNWVYKGLFESDGLQDMPEHGNFNPDYNPFDKIKGTQYEGFEDAFKYVVNDKELLATQNRIDKELKTAESYQRLGVVGSLPGIFAGGAMDPLAYVPLAGVMSKAGKMKSLWNVALLGGGINAVSALGSMTLENQQRALKFTDEEYAMGIGASAILGGVVTAGAGALTRNKIIEALADEDVLAGTKAIQKFGNLAEEEATVVANELRVSQSERINNVKIKREKAVAPFLKASPVGQVLSSPFDGAREAVGRLASHNIELEGAFAQGPSFESQMSVVRQKADNLIVDLEDVWKIQAKKGGQTGLNDFMDQVGLVLRYQEEGLPPSFKVTSEVRQASKLVKDELSKVRKGLIDQGLFTEEQLPKDYYPQIWDRSALEGNYGQFTKELTEHYVRQFEDFKLQAVREASESVNLPDSVKAFLQGVRSSKDVVNGIGDIISSLPKKQRASVTAELKRAGAFFTPQDVTERQFLEKMSDRLYYKLTTGSALETGNPVQLAKAIEDEFNLAGKAPDIFKRSGAKKAADFLKERTVDLPTETFGKYQMNNPTKFLRRYMRSVNADILSNKLFGTVDPKLIADNMVNPDLQRLLKTANPKQARKINKEAFATKSNIEQMHQRITGRHKSQSGVRGFLGHAAEIVTNTAYTLTAGGIALAQLGDLSKVALQYPIKRAYGGLLKHAFDGATRGLKKQELVRMGVLGKKLSSSLIEDAMDFDFSANQRHYDGLSDWASMEGVKDITKVMANKMNTYSGMNLMMNLLETFTGSLSMDEIMRASVDLKKGKLSKFQKTMLQKTGITERDALDFAREFNKRGGGKVENGTFLTNTNNWDAEVANRFTAFVKTQIDESMSMPRQTTPFFMNGAGGRFFWMYKSFMMGALQNNFAAALQGEALHTSLYVASAMFFGNMTYLAREASKGNINDIDMSPDRLALEGLDRSGLITWMFEGAKYAEQISGVDPLTEYIDQTKQMSRYRSRGMSIAGISPSTDVLFSRLPRFVSEGVIPGVKGRPTKKSIKAVQRMMSFSNLPYIAYPLNKLGDALGEDLPAR